MTTVGNIYDFIDAKAPFSTAMGFDNVGLLIGDRSGEVKKALVTLDVSFSAVSEAKDLGCDLIVSHHPVIFNPLSRISHNDPAAVLIKNGISVISAHTNLDMADGGVNDCLCEALGLFDVSKMMLDGCPLGRVGNVSEIKTEDFLSFVKKTLNANSVRYVKSNPYCKKIAVVCGSGGDAVDEALAAGADTLVTGEAKYNHFLYAAEKNINLIEAGHFATENVVVPILCKALSEKFPTVDFTVSERNTELPLLFQE